MRADHISPVLDAVYEAPAEIQSHGASGLQIDAMLAELVAAGRIFT